MGKARYGARRKTRLQALLAATVANFKRLGVLGAFDVPPRRGLIRSFSPSRVTDDRGTAPQVWRSVLDLDQIGVNDDFFALGGHSLLDTKVISDLPGAFGVELQLGDLFADLTVRALGRRIEETLVGDALVGSTSGSVDAVELERLVQAIEGMSDEEVDALLERPGMPRE